MDMVVEDRHGTRNVGTALGLRGRGSRRDSRSNRLIHLLEAPPELPFEAAWQEGNEDPAEPFALDEPRAPRSDGLQLEDVFPIEQSGKDKAAEPSKLAVRDHLQDLRAEPHRSRAGGAEEDVQAGALDRLPADAPDERVPVRKRLEVGQHLPPAVARAADLRLRAPFEHRAIGAGRPPSALA